MRPIGKPPGKSAHNSRTPISSNCSNGDTQPMMWRDTAGEHEKSSRCFNQQTHPKPQRYSRALRLETTPTKWLCISMRISQPLSAISFFRFFKTEWLEKQPSRGHSAFWAGKAFTH